MVIGRTLSICIHNLSNSQIMYLFRNLYTSPSFTALASIVSANRATNPANSPFQKQKPVLLIIYFDQLKHHFSKKSFNSELEQLKEKRLYFFSRNAMVSSESGIIGHKIKTCSSHIFSFHV
jgi:hypothetical protein